MKRPDILIDELIYYARKHLSMEEIDEIYFKNLLLDLLKVSCPNEDNIDLSYIDNLVVPDVLIDDLRKYLISIGENRVDAIVTLVMGMLTPSPSEVVKKVLKLEREERGKGLDYLFRLQISNNYIQKTAIDRNIVFTKKYENNFLEITINLTKPEKKNSDTAKLLVKSNVKKYPKCLLCEENLGYAGRIDHPSRQNIRIVPIKLQNEDWFIQFSPYAYFDHHIIVINSKHDFMSINNYTFNKLLDFLTQYPNYFIGSNSDLPIVGGSILNHEHYQGGLHLLPLFYSKDEKIYFDDGSVKVSSLNWYNSVIRVESKNKDEVVNYSRLVLNCWRNYDDESVGILSHTNDTRHSTITPIARKNGELYQMNLILRNNRCNVEHPDGIFHAHKEYHHIKSEAIGLIEAGGLFILPPRLKREMGYIEEVLTEKKNVETYFNMYPDLEKHKDMVYFLLNKYGNNNSLDEAKDVIKDYLGDTCKNILINTAVFKKDEKGLRALDNFMKEVLK